MIKHIKLRNLPHLQQYCYCLAVIIITALVCWAVLPIINYRIVALILAAAVSLLAILFDIKHCHIVNMIEHVMINIFHVQYSLLTVCS